MLRLPPISTRTDTLFPTRLSSDLLGVAGTARRREAALASSGQSRRQRLAFCGSAAGERSGRSVALRLTTARTIFRREQSRGCAQRSEEHTSELQSLMRSSYAVFCLKKKTNQLRN